MPMSIMSQNPFMKRKLGLLRLQRDRQARNQKDELEHAVYRTPEQRPRHQKTNKKAREKPKRHFPILEEVSESESTLTEEMREDTDTPSNRTLQMFTIVNNVIENVHHEVGLALCESLEDGSVPELKGAKGKKLRAANDTLNDIISDSMAVSHHRIRAKIEKDAEALAGPLVPVVPESDDIRGNPWLKKKLEEITQRLKRHVQMRFPEELHAHAPKAAAGKGTNHSAPSSHPSPVVQFETQRTLHELLSSAKERHLLLMKRLVLFQLVEEMLHCHIDAILPERVEALSPEIVHLANMETQTDRKSVV